jgi:thioredoxin reductase
MTEFDDDVLVVGDGPAGLTAALYLAKNGMGVHVLGNDQTPMHKAELHNHPGAPGVPGTEVMRVLRQQVIDFGGHIHVQKAAGVQHVDGRVCVSTDRGDVFTGRYLVLATGRGMHLAEALGLERAGPGVRIDLHGRTSDENVYAGGNLARGITQAVISMGDGAAIAVDILGRETGHPVHDYDVLGAKTPPATQPA